MIIETASLGPSPKQVSAEFASDDLDLASEGISIEGHARLNGEISRADDKTRLAGTITADILTVCTRCVEPVRSHLEIPFEDVFVDHDPATSDVELSSEDLDVSLAANGVIDLGEAVREQILLAMPEQMICRADCKGLCEKCGTNLNLQACGCEEDEIDPRWAALKNLKPRKG